MPIKKNSELRANSTVTHACLFHLSREGKQQAIQIFLYSVCLWMIITVQQLLTWALETDFDK